MNIHHYLRNFPLNARNFYSIKIVILALSLFGFSTCDRLSGLRKGRGFDPRWCHWIFFFLHNASGSLWVDTSSNKNEYRNISWSRGDRYHLHVSTVLKYGSLNLLEPSGPVQVGTRTAVPFTLRTVRITSPQIPKHTNTVIDVMRYMNTK